MCPRAINCLVCQSDIVAPCGGAIRAMLSASSDNVKSLMLGIRRTAKHALVDGTIRLRTAGLAEAVTKPRRKWQIT
jgi:hypothetical protein